MSQELAYAKTFRKYQRTKATKLCNNIEDNVNEYSFQDKVDARAKLEEIKAKLTESNGRVADILCKCSHSEDELAHEFQQCDEYCDKISQSFRSLGNSARSSAGSFLNNTEASGGVPASGSVAAGNYEDTSCGVQILEGKLATEVGISHTSHGGHENESNLVSSNLIDYSRYSTYSKMLNVTSNVLKFINNLKIRIKLKYPERTPNLVILSQCEIDARAFIILIASEQKNCFSEVLEFFSKSKLPTKNIPPLVLQLNLLKDEDGILRVKSKFGRWKNKRYHPILLSKSGFVSIKIIEYFHVKLSHSGVYTVLNEIRKKFYLPSIFSTVKKLLKQCIVCGKFNNRSVKLNQNSYREFRVNPSNIPFRSLFLDYIGPFNVRNVNEVGKAYLLCFTCLWSRAINLVLCPDLGMEGFLRAFQMHSFQFGIPESCHSDLGSQIVAGSNVIRNFISDEDSQNYFREEGLSPLTFQQFPKGCKELGGIVETCVKMVRKLIYSSIGRNILSYEEFSFLVCQTVHIVNRRPIALKEGLRDGDADVPTPITPEVLIRGYEIPSLNIVPNLQPVPEDVDWSPNFIVGAHNTLCKVREALIQRYRDEFLTTLISQAVDEKSRYSPVKGSVVSVGDLVLIKEDHVKRINFPMARVVEVNKNCLNEVTDVILFKGSTRENVRRHVTSIVPLLSLNETNLSEFPPDKQILPDAAAEPVPVRPKRKAATDGNSKTAYLIRHRLV